MKTGTPDAGSASSVVHVDYVPGRAVALVPSARRGVLPLHVKFELVHELTSPVTRFEADLDGNGSYEHVSVSEPMLLERTYTAPGLVIPAVRLTTADGVVTVVKTGILPQTYATLNGVIKEVWRGFTHALSRGDVASAALYFAEGAPREKYTPILELIRPTLKQFSQRIQKLGALSIGDRVAYYLLVREENGQANGHYVYFALDTDGLWKIVQM